MLTRADAVWSWVIEMVFRFCVKEESNSVTNQEEELYEAIERCLVGNLIELPMWLSESSSRHPMKALIEITISS